MADRDFFDSNVLIYAISANEPDKQSQAKNLLTDAIETATGVISAQVLGEFFTVSTSPRRVQNPLTIAEAKLVIEQVSILHVVTLDLSMVRRAVETCGRYQISYWDALIISAAERSGCTRIVTEDLNAGQEYNGIPIVNPF